MATFTDDYAAFDGEPQDASSETIAAIASLTARIRSLQRENGDLEEDVSEALKSLLFELPAELVALPTGVTWIGGQLLEEISPKEAGEGGGLRRTVHVKDGEDSYLNMDTEGFTVDATELVHINGFKDGKTSDAMTLLVLNVQVHSTEPGFNFRSVVARLSFEGPADPTIFAFAPFSSTVTWNVSKEEYERILSAGIEVGANYGASAKVTGNGQWTIRGTKEFFAHGNASRIINSNKWRGVKWYLEGNPSQSGEVTPEFRIAVLVKRAKPNEPFTGTLTLRPEGSVASSIQMGLRRFFGIDPRRARKAFDSKEVKTFTNEGKLLLEQCKADEDHLGKLAHGSSLTGLAYVWGLDLISGSTPGTTAPAPATAPAAPVNP